LAFASLAAFAAATSVVLEAALCAAGAGAGSSADQAIDTTPTLNANDNTMYLERIDISMTVKT
jgi:hypothetical protein